MALLPAVGRLAIFAQNATSELPQGRFSKKTILVGEPLDYDLTYLHEPDLEVIFPDSLARFAPFEYAGKTFYPTRTRNGRSLDRVVYHLRTFALDSVQMLALPVAVLRLHDTLSIAPTKASVRLRRTAPAPPPGNELPALRQNLVLQPIPPRFNYPYWLAGAAAVLALVGGAVLFFRRRLRRRYAVYKRSKNHRYFLAQFARHAERFTLSQSVANVERAVTLWKNYLASLDRSDLNSFTTREIVQHFNNDEDVQRGLATTDRVIYGNLLSEEATEVDRAFQRLLRFAERRYAALNEAVSS